MHDRFKLAYIAFTLLLKAYAFEHEMSTSFYVRLHTNIHILSMPFPYIQPVSMQALMQIQVYIMASLHLVLNIQVYDHFFNIHDHIALVLQRKGNNALVFEHILFEIHFTI